MQEHFQINIFYSIRAVACIAVCLFFLEIEMIKHGLQNKNKDHVLEHVCNFILKQKELCNFWGYTKLHDPKQALPPKKKKK